MTIEETIERIEDVLSSDHHYDGTLVYQLTLDDFEWLETAKQALEKQIPKKPGMSDYNYDNSGNLVYDTYDCPNCHTSHEMEYDEYDILKAIIKGKSIECCPHCGQALDWSGRGEDN